MTAAQSKGLVFTPHPIVDALIPPLSLDEILRWGRLPNGEHNVLEYWNEHEGMIRDAQEDPLDHGFELPFWPDFWQMFDEKDEIYALGGNGPGKTEIGAKAVVKVMTKLGGRNVLCIANNESVSKQLQQPPIYRYSPPSAREFNERAGSKRRGVVAKFNYTVAGGFTESTFVYPNGSQCWFRTVEQFERDPDSFEGPEYDLVWADEPIPLGLREALMFRVGKRGGKFLFTFTAVNGYDAICAVILDGARVVKSLPINWQWKVKRPLAPPEGGPDVRIQVPELKLDEVHVKGLAPGHMPYIMQPVNPKQGIIFLWSQWNPFSARSKDNPLVPALFEKCVLKPKSTVKMRLFGWTEKRAGSQFPNFNIHVHVVSRERINELLKPKNGRVLGVSSFHCIDPATARSYYLLWMLVDALGRKYVFHESPSMDEGEWVGEDGEPGEGQSIYAGKGITFYKRLIRRIEGKHGLEPLRRFGDPRAFATESQQKEGAKDLFTLFQEGAPEGTPPEEELELGPLFYEPALVRASLDAEVRNGSLDKINNALAYDLDKPVVIGVNEPMLYISDDCQNLIKCMINWNPSQGEKSPWKDPVDALRYLFGEELYYSDPTISLVRGGKGWGAR